MRRTSWAVTGASTMLAAAACASGASGPFSGGGSASSSGSGAPAAGSSGADGASGSGSSSGPSQGSGGPGAGASSGSGGGAGNTSSGSGSGASMDAGSRGGPGSSSSGSGSSSGARVDAGGSSSSSGGSPDSGSCGVPTSFQWSSTGPIIAPKSDATHNLTAIKDPTVVFFNNRWNIYASTTDGNGTYNSVYLGFADWASAGAAPQSYLSGGVAPQVFYFAPQNMWYRVYEWPDVYATSTDPTQPQSWSPGKNFYASVPAIVTRNQGTGGWIDFWVICNDASCFLFFSDDNGNFYRASTPIGSFPNGFGTPVIVLHDASAGRLFEASNVYSMKGTGQYLLLIEAYDGPSGGRRYFRSWKASALDGAWTPLQAEYTTPFASAKNVTFGGMPWTQDISHGEMLRSGYDQKLEIDPCNLQYLYQGKDPTASGSYNTLPWRLGLLTKTN